MKFLIMVDIFHNFSLNWKFTIKTDFKTKSNQLDIFANRVIYFWIKLPNQIKSSNGDKTKIKFKLDGFRKWSEQN